MELDIMAKDKGRASTTSRPGAVPSSGGLGQMEQDLVAKERGMSSSTSNPPGAGGLSRMEQDIMAKDRGRPMATKALSQPGAVSSSGGLGQMEQDILLKEQEMGVTSSSSRGLGSSTSAGLNQLEQDLLTKQHEQASGQMAMVPRGSQHQIAGSAGLSQMERDLITKQESHRSSGQGGLNSLESEILAKNDASFSEGFTITPVNAHMGGAGAGYSGQAGLNSLENDIRSKHESSFSQEFSLNPVNSHMGGTGRPASHRDVIGLGPEDGYVHSQHPPPHQVMHSDLDYAEVVPSPSQGMGVEIVPVPMTVPYDMSDDPEVAVQHTSVSVQEQPSTDAVPDSGIEAYVPAAVVHAAGVAVVNEEEEKRLETQKRRRYLMGGCCCLIVVAIAIIVPVAITSGESPPKIEIPPSAAPSAVPSSSPSSAPTSEFFAQFLDEVLRPLDVSAGDELFDVNSPQYQAALWLILEDRLSYWPEARLTMDHPKVLQRYALAVFHYSTNGDDWYYCGKNTGNCFDVTWLTSFDECDWFAITCDDNGYVEMMSFGK